MFLTDHAKKILSSVLMALLTYIALFNNGKIFSDAKIFNALNVKNIFAMNMVKIDLLMPASTLESSLAFILLLYLYYKYQHYYAEVKKEPLVLACFFGLWMQLGRSYHLYDSSILFWQGKFQLLISILVIIGYILLFYGILIKIIESLDSYRMGFDYFETNNLNHLKWVDSFKLPLLILICWLPILIVFYPGSVDFDSFKQLRQWSGADPYRTHHPIISTIFVGCLMEFGKFVASANKGAFFIVFIQTLLLLFMITNLIRKMRKMNAPRILVILTILFFSVCPIWAGYAQCVIKDSMNLGSNLMLFLIYIDLLIDDKWLLSGKNKIILFIGFLGSCCFRNTGIYLVILSVIPILIYQLKKYKINKILFKIFALFLIIHISFNNFALPILGVKRGPIAEMLSIPLQQTVRYLKYYPTNLTNEERKVLLRIFDLKKIVTVYNPSLSDPVKLRANINLKRLPNYFKVWIRLGVRHPGVYLDALFNHTYCYFYPNSISKTRNTGMKFYIKEKIDRNGANHSPNDGTYDVRYLFSSNLREPVKYFLNDFWRKIPILGLCYNVGIYTWILLTCFMLLLYFKKKYAIFGLLPSFATVLFCLASPVNGYVRYMLPVIAFTPLNIGWTIYWICNREGVSK